jgi:hypothetical protein
VGFVLGIIIGGLYCAAVLAIIVKYDASIGMTVSQSVIARFLTERFPLSFILALLPREFDSIRDFLVPS